MPDTPHQLNSARNIVKIPMSNEMEAALCGLQGQAHRVSATERVAIEAAIKAAIEVLTNRATPCAPGAALRTKNKDQ